jgi:signal peptide peptidase SppA
MDAWRLEQALSIMREGKNLAVQSSGNHQELLSVSPGKPYAVSGNGIAVIPIMGPMVKGGGKNGEADSVEIRRSLRAAVQDTAIGGIMLVIDSPGGTVAGTDELARDVRSASEVKPTAAHIEDLGASAAYWVASQAGTITANHTAEVGSIGTMAMVEDSSGAAKADGIVVHVVSTGAYKGAFSPGTEITPDHLAYLQEQANALNTHFMTAVSKGRKVGMSRVETWADGRAWIASTAKDMGLIDGVTRLDDAMRTLQKSIPKRTMKSQILRSEIELASIE